MRLIQSRIHRFGVDHAKARSFFQNTLNQALSELPPVAAQERNADNPSNWITSEWPTIRELI